MEPRHWYGTTRCAKDDLSRDRPTFGTRVARDPQHRRRCQPNSSPLAAILEGIFRLRDVNPTLRTDILFALLQRINLWHHQGFITSYAHGNSNAAMATIHGNACPKAKIGIWKKVSILVNEGQRTGNDVPQPQPDFENGAREHNFADGVFAFQASTRLGQHAHWCECNGPTCDSRNRTSPPSRPRPFSVSAINPAIGYRLRQTIVDELNYFANCGKIIPFSMDAARFNSAAAINGVLPFKEKRRVWKIFADLLAPLGHDSMSFAYCSESSMPHLGNQELFYDLQH
eukprot:g3236.t1